ncbi:MAG: hypothetical protein K8R77_01290 [Anaerolineaceae bacterium]|nr:hypothetical protein [Anaerolineaceae bacterium]
MDSENIVISLVSGVVAGTFIAIADRLLGDRKSIKSQLFSLRAQAERSRAETVRRINKEQDFKRRFDLMEAALAETKYHLVQIVEENIIYDGTDGIEGFDVVAVGRRNNSHFFNNKVLIIDRMGKKGVYQLQLRKYIVDGKEFDYFAGAPQVRGKRRLRVSFEARVQEGKHTVSVAFTSFRDNRLLGKRELMIDSTNWEDHDLFFEVSSRQDSLLQIIDLFQAKPGDLQIRNLVLAEQVRQPRTGGGHISASALQALIRSEG